MSLQDILSAIHEYLPKGDTELVRKAYAFVRDKHKGQTRSSGEPYINHVQEVALLLTKLRLDISSIVAGLLHDTVEDTDVTVAQIAEQFNPEIAEIVDGVTKLSQINFTSKAEAQAENFRKMLLAMAKDIRVILLKVCDRLHNMRTLEFLSEARRMRIAQETLDIYAPLCHRLGIYWMKSELEDLSLRFLKPSIYEQIKHSVAENRRERESYLNEVVHLLERELEVNGITGRVMGRSKHFYSIYQKMERDGLNFNEIYDLIAFRIIVPSVMDCYAALGLVHAAWKPIPGRFRDFIAMPKPNKYQSLHTTVIGPKGARIEIQIRTEEMHEVAERGIAAHWIYKETADGEKAVPKEGFQFSWIRDLLESQSHLQDPIEFMSAVKEDLFSQEVYVFTPKGDLIALASGATPIDFAYAIHSEVGHHCTGAKVNGQLVGLSHKLHNGDTIDITTSKTQSPSKDWLALVSTNKARQRIRSFLKAEERERSIAVGKELLTKDLRQLKSSLNSVIKDGSLAKVAQDLGLKEVDLLLAEIGYGKISAKQVAGSMFPNAAQVETRLEQQDSALQRMFNQAAKVVRENTGIKVNGFEDMVFRFARCCEPLPGQELVGYVTRGRGVAIHARGCPQTLSFDPQRLIPVGWDSEAKTLRRIRLQVLTVDRVGILAALTQCISNAGANIVSATVNTTPQGKSLSGFELNVESSKQLDTITRSMEQIEGVIRIERARAAQERGHHE